VVPPATPVLTVRASLLADHGIGFALRNPAGRLTTGFTFPDATEVPDMTWIDLRKPSAGTWRLGVECGRRCDFSFGFYLKDAVPKLEPDLPAYDDATVRFTEETDGTSTRVNQFHLPANVSILRMRVSLATQDGFLLRLEDPQGHARATTSFPNRAYVDDASYLVMNEPPSGTWSFRAECRAGCAYGVGVYVA
jgi:hypothetical protein